MRDKLLGVAVSDRDFVVVGSSAEEMLAHGFKQVGHDFPVFLHPKTGEEYALARTERKSGSGYLGFTCDFSPEVTLEEDLRRRDLTINAMAEDEKGNIIDPYGGRADLQQRVLRHVSAAFIEDPLRVLRVARFAARYRYLGFTIAPETMQLMREIALSGELISLTAERVWQELLGALQTHNPEVFIRVLRRTGALHSVLPEVDALYGVPGPVRWHPEIDSGIHTCMTLSRVAMETEDPLTRFAMLCHDLGKGCTPIKQWPHHKDHHLLGLKPLHELCTRLKVPTEYAEFAALVVQYHSDMHHVYRNGPAGVVDLLDHLDAWRRPWRIKPFVQCCKCDFLGRKGFENRPYPRADYFLGMFSLCSQVRAQEFVKLGFKGRDIKEQVRLRRIELMSEYFTTLPRTELDDSDNEMPPYVLASLMIERRGVPPLEEHPH